MTGAIGRLSQLSKDRLVRAVAGIEGADDSFDVRRGSRKIFRFLFLQIRVHGTTQVHHAVESFDIENRHRSQARMLLEDLAHADADLRIAGASRKTALLK